MFQQRNLDLFQVSLVYHTNHLLDLAKRTTPYRLANKKFVDELMTLVDQLCLDLIGKVHRLVKELLVGHAHRASVLLRAQHIEYGRPRRLHATVVQTVCQQRFLVSLRSGRLL